MQRQAVQRVGIALALMSLGTGCGIVTTLSDPDPLPLPGCEFAQALVDSFGAMDGEQITVLSSISGTEESDHLDSYRTFESCTGTSVRMESTNDLADELNERLAAGSPPDLVYFPQPGLLQQQAKDHDGMLPLPDEAASAVDEWFDESWSDYASVDGVQYAVPVDSSAKSVVWYSPRAFAAAGYEPPETWAEMIALTQSIAAEQSESRPWCVGSEAGDASGWMLTDWLEDAVLRLAGRSFYDRWVAHEIPFDHPEVVQALDMVGEILKDPRYVNGGFGGVTSIVETDVLLAGRPLLDGACWMHRGGTSYAINLIDANVAADGELFGFYFPVMSTGEDRPVLAGGNFAARFTDRSAVAAFLTYLASPEWANERAAISGVGWLSANRGLDVSQLRSEVDQVAAQLLQNERTVVAFDGSDLMPPEIGTGAFWREMNAWIAQDQSSSATLAAIEQAWPSA